MLIKAAVTHRLSEDFKIEKVELAPPEQDEVLIKIVAMKGHKGQVHCP